MQNRQQSGQQDSSSDPERWNSEQLQAVKEGYNRLRGCVDAEHCEYVDCMYFENPEQLRTVISFLDTAINQAEREQLQQDPSADRRHRQR